jgi:hypothetical protein
LKKLSTVISLDSVTAPCASFLAAAAAESSAACSSTESATNEIELQRLQNQKLLKYSPSDNFSPELEREIDDMIAKAAYNESQKTFQQMSRERAY